MSKRKSKRDYSGIGAAFAVVAGAVAVAAIAGAEAANEAVARNERADAVAASIRGLAYGQVLTVVSSHGLTYEIEKLGRYSDTITIRTAGNRYGTDMASTQYIEVTPAGEVLMRYGQYSRPISLGIVVSAMAKVA